MSKHILLYTDDPGLGGVAQYNHSLLCGLAASGYRLTCVQSKNSNPLVSRQNELGIQHLWLEFDTTRDFERTLINSSDVQGILSNAKPELIIFSDSWPFANFAAKQVAIQLGMPYIVVVGWVGLYSGGLPPEYLDELSRHYAESKAVIAVSNENLSLLHQIFGLPKDKGQVIHYGRPAQYFVSPNSSVRENLRQKFNIPSDAVVCFTSARLDPIKGYQYQLAAIEQLKQSQVWPLLYFVWAGAGKLEAKLREAVNQLGVTNQVKILGQRWDIPEWLDSIDIFVLPSQSEGMPLSIMEAMAKGLPVIASAVSGVPEELGDTGKLLPDPKVEPQATVRELVTTIQAWYVNPELRYSIGQACKSRAEAMFKEERMVKETVEVIEGALHLQDYFVSGVSNNRFLNKDMAVRQAQEMMQQAVALLGNNQPAEAMRMAEKAASIGTDVLEMHYLRCVCFCRLGRLQEALAAAKAELTINPTHRQAEAEVERLTRAICRPETIIPTKQRTWNTALPRETMLSIELGSHNYSYRGVPMIKNPFDVALYPLLMWNLKPRTIIEIGSKDGGSAVWLGDMLKNFSIDGHIYSVDIVKVTAVHHSCITFMEGNGRALQEIFTSSFLNLIPRPLLVIEDADHAYENSKQVLEFFHPYLREGDYIIIEDGMTVSGPIKALREFLSTHEGEYEIDGSYSDLFGYNITWCINGYLKKIRNSTIVADLSAPHVESVTTASATKTLNKKALVFFPHSPYPPRTGAHQRCLALLSGLKELGYDVTLFGSTLITDNPWQFNSINDLQNDFGIRVEVYQGTLADQQFMAQMNVSREGAVNWDIYTPPGLRESFRQLFISLAPGMIVMNYAFWASLAIGDEFKSAVKVIDMHDLLTLNTKMQQAAWSYLTNPPFSTEKLNPRLIDENFFSKLRLDADSEEYQLYEQYDFTIAIASQEEQCIRAHTFQTQVEYIPLFFDVKLLNNTYTSYPLFLIGPNVFNVQGYLYFATKVLPIVLSQLPEFVLQVIGDGCKLLVPTDGIHLLGFVPDLKPLYAESRFAVCPLIGGTGQQVKIVEAMAHGVPVIALQNVAESSPIEHGINGFIAKNAEEFAKYTVQLFCDQDLCRKLGQAARQTIAEKFSKNVLIQRLKQITDKSQEELKRKAAKTEELLPTIIVDGVFFQLYKTGIARVWRSLLEEWVENGFAKHIVVLDRARTAPKIPGIRYRPLPPYDYSGTNGDREMLQQVCNEEGADLFVSTYYTTPVSTPSAFMVYDMIPEVMGWNLDHPMWEEKNYSIQQASAYIAISENTARDLVKFFPHISSKAVTVAPCGVRSTFFPASLEEVNSFKTKYGISKPYFILVGTGGYKNTILFLKAFYKLYSRHGFEIVCTGSGLLLEAEFRAYTSGSLVHMLQLSDEELSTAYSGAVALVYPSKYEGFGLPVLEAIACGCPVITCPNASIPEVAGEAALYVNDDDVNGLANALCDVQKPDVRKSLISAGLEQAKKFSWSKMAKTVSSALIDATLLLLNLKDINLIVFPDWSAPEEPLCFELEQVIKAIATHPDRSQMTLLVYTGNIPEEDAALILSSVTMNLLLQEDLDVSEGPEISLVGQLGEIQWEALLPRIQARIVLENENQQAMPQARISSYAAVKAEAISSYNLDSFSSYISSS